MTTETPGTELRFHGTIDGVAIKQPKAQQSYYGTPVTPTGGDLGLSFKVERPQPPKAPTRPWQLNNPKPEPHAGNPPKRKAKETDEEYEERCKPHLEKVARAEAEIAAYERLEAQWVETQRQHQQALRDFAPKLMAYAQLTGIAAAIGNVRCEVIIRPVLQDVLPGFSATAMLLDGPADEVDEDGFTPALAQAAADLEDAEWARADAEADGEE